MNKLLSVLLLGLLLAGCGGEEPISGQIFIVTKSRENVKLGLVTVKVYDEDGIEKIRSAAKSIFEQRLASVGANTRWDDFKKDWIDSAIAEATPSAEAKTDADGRFLFIPPSDKFMLAASSSRLAGDEQENYRWLEVFQVNTIGPSGLLLSNDNLLEDLAGPPVLPPDAWDRFKAEKERRIKPFGGLKALAKIKGAKESGATGLDLGESQISDITPLKGLTNLKDLQLSYNQISDVTPLAGLTNLVRLDLFSNQITDLTPLARLTKLEWLDLRLNPIPVDQREMLKKALPNCDIEF